MNKSELYNKIYEIVAKHDPVGIAWCPKDEYESEVTGITARAYVLPEEKLAEHIYEVFKFWFGSKLVPNPKKTDMYKEMAKEIKALFPKKETE